MIKVECILECDVCGLKKVASLVLIRGVESTLSPGFLDIKSWDIRTNNVQDKPWKFIRLERKGKPCDIFHCPVCLDQL